MVEVEVEEELEKAAAEGEMHYRTPPPEIKDREGAAAEEVQLTVTVELGQQEEVKEEVVLVETVEMLITSLLVMEGWGQEL